VYATVGCLLIQIATQVFPFIEISNWIDKLNRRGEPAGYYRAVLYLSLNNKDEALRALEQGYEERDGSNIGWIRVDPLLNPLRR